MAPLAELSLDRETGKRRLLRYSTTIVNVGAGSFELQGHRPDEGSPFAVAQRVHDADGGWRTVETSATTVFAGDGHDHWHITDLQLAQPIELDHGQEVARSEKRGFCLWDNREYRLELAGAPAQPVYREDGCGEPGSLDLAMGLSVGWGDIYPAWLPDRYIDVSQLRSGRFRLVVTADPLGWFAESDVSNNATWVDIELRGNHVTVLSYGPPG